MKWILGTVPYLNALPLIWALEKRDDVELVRLVPSQLGEHLERGDFHASLSPVFDYISGIGDQLLGDAIVGATRQVRSVLLFHRGPVEKMKSVALDQSSHSSVNLTRVLLRDFYHIEPRFENAPPDLDAMLAHCEGAVLIGDPALETAQTISANSEVQILDLAGAWHHFTGLSFTFAAWTARHQLEKADELSTILNAARDEGEREIEQIVAANPTNSKLSPQIRDSYLREAIEYHLTPAHNAGLHEFARRLKS